MVPFWVWFWVLVGAFVPVLLFMLLADLSAVWDRVDVLRQRIRPPASVTRSPPLEQAAANLHRLGQHLDHVESSHEMHIVERLRAASLAYDEALLAAARTLEVDAPERGPLDPVLRLEIEAALAQQGLVW